MANIYRDLAEAYQQVYTPQEVDEATAMAKRGHDETKLRQRAGGGEAADRATSLENRPTYGDANKAKQRQNYARAQRGDFRKTASSNPGLHVGQHKSDDPAVKAKQAARGAQRGALTPNERKQLNMGDESFDIFDLVLEFLQVEGYAETLEEAEWMMANIIDEEAIEIILGEEQLDEISQKTATKAYAQSATGEFEGADSDRDIKRTNNLRRHIQRKFGDEAAKNADKHADATTFGRKDPRTGKRQPSPKPRIEKNRTYRTTKAGKMHGQDQSKLKRDLEYKRSSRTEEFVGEAQVANRDPEKYEREQAKKSAPVRGERTPMPPRGDKRREDFEKWYAKQMGR
jgi:hypothetical protein